MAFGNRTERFKDNTLSITIVPIAFSNKDLLSALSLFLEQVLQCTVAIEHFPVSYQSAYSTERNQFYSTKIIAAAISELTIPADKIILMAEFDLYVPVLTYIFGEAQLGGRFSIVSTCRLHEEFYNGEKNDLLLLDRSAKEVLHELGHTFGLKHCTDWNCIMHSSALVEQVDIKGMEYCMHCKNAITANGYKFRN